MIDASYKRFEALKNLIKEQGLSCYWVPSTDEWQNEYPPMANRRRAAVTGFSGSAGDAIVTDAEVHLFVDGRYHIQAEQEVHQAVVVHKVGMVGVLGLHDWLRQTASHANFRLGFDPNIISQTALELVHQALAGHDYALLPVAGNLVDKVWSERPLQPDPRVFALPLAYSGQSSQHKISRVQDYLEQHKIGALLLNELDSIAWLTNLRGYALENSPLFEARLLISSTDCHLFTRKTAWLEAMPSTAEKTAETVVSSASETATATRTASKMASASTAETLLEALPENFKIYNLDDFEQLLPAIINQLDRQTVLANPAHLPHAISQLDVNFVKPNTVNSSDNLGSPVTLWKSIKNQTEIECAIHGHELSALAKIRAFSQWHSLGQSGELLSEQQFSDLLYEEYQKLPGFHCLSFPNIVASGKNGASIHYSQPAATAFIKPNDLLLVDSGIQINGTTTDDTRTVILGEANAQQRFYYTNVLKAHINLARQVFPEGSHGAMLDAIARSGLWNVGLDYGHGTGHGVGAFLNVHEGPQSISARSKQPLQAGMVVSNEPGYYKHGWGGIRLENLMLIDEAKRVHEQQHFSKTKNFSDGQHPMGLGWLGLQCLTLLPFEAKLIQAELLNNYELDWLVGYHRLVLDRLHDGLEPVAREWLAQSCGQFQ